MVEEAPGKSGFQAESLVAGKTWNGEGRLRAGESGSLLVGHPPPRARAGQGRDLRAGPQKGGGAGSATLVTQGACGWAQNASLSLQRCVRPLRS